MKKALSFALSLLLICSFSSISFAAELSGNGSSGNATISTEVPQTHNISVSAEHAEVVFQGLKTDLIVADRQSQPTVIIRAESGYKISKVMLGTDDITAEIVGGYYTFPKVISDEELIISTVSETMPPQDPSKQVKFSVIGTVSENSKPLEGADIELRSMLKTAVTDKNGEFALNGVEAGRHSLTVIRGGYIVGYIEFTLDNTSESKDIEIVKDSDGTYVISVKKDFNIIELNFNLNKSGEMDITDGKASAEAPEIPSNPENPADTDGQGHNESPDTPKTGGKSDILIYSAIAVFSAGAVFIVIASGKRKKQNSK